MRFTQPASLTQLPYASLLYHWGFLLPCREVRGFLVIDVNTLECFSVKIRQGHEPVIVFATPVFFASRDLGFGYGGFSHRGPIVIRFLGMALVSFRRGSCNHSANDRRLGVCKWFNGRKDYKYASQKPRKTQTLPHPKYVGS